MCEDFIYPFIGLLIGSLIVIFTPILKDYIFENVEKIRHRIKSKRSREKYLNSLKIKPDFIVELLNSRDDLTNIDNDVIAWYFEGNIFPMRYDENCVLDYKFYFNISYDFGRRRDKIIKEISDKYIFFIKNAKGGSIDKTGSIYVPMILKIREDMRSKPELPDYAIELYMGRITKLSQLIEKDVDENYNKLVSEINNLNRGILDEADHVIENGGMKK